MTLHEFSLLSMEQQFEYLWLEGKYLVRREKVASRYTLYSLEDFYCEISFHKEGNKLDSIATFKSMNPLEPYLYLINFNIE